jgi:hypothetical protein
MRPIACEAPLLKEPTSVPSFESVYDLRVPALRPFWSDTATVVSPANPVSFDMSTAMPPIVMVPAEVCTPAAKVRDAAPVDPFGSVPATSQPAAVCV